MGNEGQQPKSTLPVERTAIEMLLQPLVEQAVIRALEKAFDVYKACAAFDRTIVREEIERFKVSEQQMYARQFITPHHSNAQQAPNVLHELSQEKYRMDLINKLKSALDK